jgi:hypothetical protein
MLQGDHTVTSFMNLLAERTKLGSDVENFRFESVAVFIYLFSLIKVVSSETTVVNSQTVVVNLETTVVNGITTYFFRVFDTLISLRGE